MSIKYLYVTQKPDNIYTVTIYNTSAPIKGLSHIKFVVPHYHNDPMILIDNFLTTHGFLFMVFNPPVIGGFKGKTYDLREKPFPLADLYLALGPLQSDVLMKFDEKLGTISKLDTRMNTLESEIKDLRGSLGTDLIKVISEHIGTFKEELNKISEVPDINGIKEGLERSMRALDIRVETLETNIVTEDRMNFLNERIRSFSKIISENTVSIPVFTEISMMRDRLNSIESSINNFKTYVADEFINVKTIVSEQIEELTTEIVDTKQSISHKHFINDEYFGDSSSESDVNNNDNPTEVFNDALEEDIKGYPEEEPVSDLQKNETGDLKENSTLSKSQWLPGWF